MKNLIRDPWFILFLFVALGNLASGTWMLIDPLHWYSTLPGQVPDFGSFNGHFIRDLGCMFMMFAIMAGIAAVRPWFRSYATLGLLFWYLPHAFVHIADTLSGRVSREHWVLDLPLCYLPTALLISMFYLLKKDNQGGHVE